MSIVRMRYGAQGLVHPLSSVCSKRLSSAVVPVDEPQYPPIQEKGPLLDKLRRKEVWHDWLKSHDTVEEKLFEINMPKYWGWRSIMLRDNAVPYNFLPWAQFATRTHFEEDDNLNNFYSDSSIDNVASKLSSVMKSEVENVILMEFHHLRRKEEYDLKREKELSAFELHEVRTKSFVKNLNQVLLSGIASDAKHLNLATVVPDPRIEAFWFLGGINPSEEKILERKRRTNMVNINVRKGYLDPSLVDGPVNEPVQYYGKPVLQIQTRYPLPSATELLDADPHTGSIPHLPYEPHVMYLNQEYRYATTIPGFWPGEPHEFGMMSFHSSNCLNDRPFGEDDLVAATHSSAILASFAWLLGQACYQGFSIFHDVTYPLSTQTVFTNGKDWSFYLYQLNTTLLHTKNSTDNPRCNLCWGTKKQSLFEEVLDGRVVGLNEDVLKQIIKLYLIEPREREIEMKPFLAEKCHVADIDYEERREWLEKQYKYFAANRKRMYDKPEMYAWEYIHRVKHNDMPRLKKVEWFMTQEAPPDCKRLDGHPRIFKPNPLRTEEDNKFVKQIRRWKRTFYPGTNKEPLIPPGK